MANALNLDLTTLVYNNTTYSNPSWITALSGAKLTGTVTANAIASGTYNISITGTSAGAPPTGSAGGDLTGTFPNPTISAGAVTNAKISNATIDLTAKVTGLLPILNGGTNSSGQSGNGINYFDGSKITSGGNFTFDGTGSVVVQNTSGDVFFNLRRQNSSHTAQIFFQDVAGTNSYSVGIINADSLFHIFTSSGGFVNINPVGGISSSTFSASKLTGTDSSSTLTSGNLTGDITSSAFATTIGNNIVTYSKFQQVAANNLLGNATGSLANVSGITLGATLTFSGSALQTTALSGDVTTSANSFSTTLATVNASPGTTGSSSVVPVITYNAKGLLTLVSSATITPAAIGAPTTTGTGATGTWGISITGTSSGAPPTGAAGGDLTGTFPNPTLANVNSNTGSFGTSSQVGNFTANAKGLVTAASNISIQISESQVTNLTTDLSSKLNLSGGTMTGNLFLNADPTSSLQAVTKNYVDSITAGFNNFSVQAASTANLSSTYNNGSSGVGATLTSPSNVAFSLDGQSGALNNQYLIKNQTSTFQNGIYTLTTVGSGSAPWVLTRSSNYNLPADITTSDLVVVIYGTVNAASTFLQTSTVTNIGTDAITFSMWGGQNITLSGDVTGNGFSPVSTTIAANAVTYAKFQQMTANTLHGNPTGSTANSQAITLGATLNFTGTSLQTNAFTGDVTSSANSFATSIASGAVTTSKIGTGAVNLATQVSGVLPVANGGTATSTAFTPGSLVFAGTSGVYNQNNSQLFWDSTNNRLGVGTNSPTAPFHVQSGGGLAVVFRSVGANAYSQVFIDRNDTSSQSILVFSTAGLSNWALVTGNVGAGTSLAVNYNGGTALLVDTTGGLTVSSKMSSASANISGLTASSPVFTDSSKNLTSSGTVPISSGGTNNTNFPATVSGSNALIFYSGSSTTNGNLGGDPACTYNPTQGILTISSGSVNPGITVSTTSSSGVVSFLSAGRYSSTQGSAQYRLLSATSTDWAFGTNAGSQNLVFSSNSSATTLLTMNYGASGGVVINTGTLQYPFADADKILLMGKSNSAKIAHTGGWGFSSYAGSQTADGGGPSTGLFNWNTVNSAGTGFQNVMTLANAGDLSVTGNISISTVGKGLNIKGGTNARIGTATLVGGTVTVSTTAVATGDIILITCSTAGGTQGIVRVSAISNGVSFTLTSSQSLDTSTYTWVIFRSI